MHQAIDAREAREWFEFLLWNPPYPAPHIATLQLQQG